MYQMDSGSPVLTGSVMHCWPAKKAVGMSTAGHLTTFGPAQWAGGRANGRWRSKTKGDSYVSAHSKLL